jgi:hypothetical protein
MKRLLGLVAIGGLMVLAVPSQRAEAASLINPAVSLPIAAAAADSGITEVRWHRHHWHRWHWRRPHHHHWRRWHHRRW